MSGKKSPEFQWTDDDPEIQLNNCTDCLLKRLLRKLLRLLLYHDSHFIPD